MHENFWWLLGTVLLTLILSWGLTALIARLLKGKLGTRHYPRYQRAVRWTRFLGGVQMVLGAFWLILLPVYGYSTGYMLVGILVVSAFAIWMIAIRWHWLEHYLMRAEARREEEVTATRSPRPELFHDAHRRSAR